MEAAVPSLTERMIPAWMLHLANTISATSCLFASATVTIAPFLMAFVKNSVLLMGPSVTVTLPNNDLYYVDCIER